MTSFSFSTAALISLFATVNGGRSLMTFGPAGRTSRPSFEALRSAAARVLCTRFRRSALSRGYLSQAEIGAYLSAVDAKMLLWRSLLQESFCQKWSPTWHLPQPSQACSLRMSCRGSPAKTLLRALFADDRSDRKTAAQPFRNGDDIG